MKLLLDLCDIAVMLPENALQTIHIQIKLYAEITQFSFLSVHDADLILPSAFIPF